MKFPIPELFTESPSVDTSNRHERDAWLRRHGFRIHARPKGQQPLWERNGTKYRQSRAVEIATEEGD